MAEVYSLLGMKIRTTPKAPPPNYNPFYTPVNKDGLAKTFHYTKHGAICGGFMGFADAILYTQPGSLAVLLSRLYYHSSLFAAMGATYGGTMVICGGLRQKDDGVNHFLAGFATGGVLGIRFKSQAIGWQFGLLFGVAAAVAKVGAMEGWAFTFRKDPRKTPIEYPLNHYKKSYLVSRDNEEGNQDIVDYDLHKQLDNVYKF